MILLPLWWEKSLIVRVCAKNLHPPYPPRVTDALPAEFYKGGRGGANT